MEMKHFSRKKERKMYMYILILIRIFLSVGYFTLLERKALSYIQVRKGPNKPSFLGFILPLADAIKLFSKERGKVSFTNKNIFCIFPFFGVLVIITL
jgi:NADH-quinone oxidoreductase subunit H